MVSAATVNEAHAHLVGSVGVRADMQPKGNSNEQACIFLIYLYGIERVDLPFAVWNLHCDESPNPGKYVV